MRYLVLNYAYGMGSWGDEMILDGVLNGLGRANCTVHSWDSNETRQMHNVEAIGWDEFWPDYDVLYIGGAAWGNHPHSDHVCAAIREAQEYRAKVIIDAAGFWPGEEWRREAHTFARVEQFSVRDPLSKGIMRHWVKRVTPVVPDPSQRMGIAPVDVGEGPWIGVNVANATPLQKLVPLCRELIRRDYKLLGLATMAHKQRDELDGHMALRKLSALLDYEILDPPGPWHKDSLGPRELAGLAQNCEKIIGMRKHACWLAQRVDKPLLAINWYSEHTHPAQSHHQLMQLRPVIPHRGFCDLTNHDDPIVCAGGRLLKDPERAWMPELTDYTGGNT